MENYEKVIGAQYVFASLPGYGENGLDSIVGQYNGATVTVLREQIEGVDEENRPMYIVQGPGTPEFTVFAEELR